MSRGGSRNRGFALANNTSGLAGIRFAWMPSKSGELLYPYVRISVHTAVGQRQRSYSINKYGHAGALMLAIAVRRRARYPTPSLEEARRALRRFLKG